MKKIFLVFLLLSIISTALYSEDTNSKKSGIGVPIIGVFTRTEASTSVNVSGKYTESTQLRQMLMLDLMLGKRIYFYGQLGVDFPTTKGNILYPNTIFGVGVGGYIIDKRVNSIGHSWTANLVGSTKLFAMDYGFGGEISTFYNYNINRRFALRVGLSLGYYSYGSFDFYFKWLRDPLETEFEPDYSHNINYGLSIGIAF